MSTRTPDDDSAPRYDNAREPKPRYVVPGNAPPRNQILLLLMLLLVVLLIAVATGRGMLLRFGGSSGSGGPSGSAGAEALLPTRIQDQSVQQTSAGCRVFAETGRQICGTIRTFYEQNGDLPAFGQPLNDQHQEMVEGKPFQAQWFERGRIELHPENSPPYHVLLGRLGAESLGRAGMAWTNFATTSRTAANYFEKTNQAIAPEFWSYWSGRGLNFDGVPGNSFEESLALFGYPISGPLREPGADGKLYLTQWFERAHFEYHPEASASNQVQVERFGNKLFAGSSAPAGATPTPTRQP